MFEWQEGPMPFAIQITDIPTENPNHIMWAYRFLNETQARLLHIYRTQ